MTKIVRTELLLALVAAVCVACSGSGDEHDPDDHHHDEDVGDHHGDDAGDSDDSGHSHDGDSGHATADDADVSVDTGTDLTITGAATTYCECMLVQCHDEFHEKFGESDPVAIANCETEASQLPVEGTEQMSGNSIECRQYHCDQAADGEDTCGSALGGGECQ